jgi:hypothetical protein
MRPDIKELADFMEIGWKTIPKMHSGNFFKFDDFKKFRSDNHIVACCALGHLKIGVSNNNLQRFYLSDRISVLDTQLVEMKNGRKITLVSAIIKLNDEYHWSTPEIVAWLRSHEND